MDRSPKDQLLQLFVERAVVLGDVVLASGQKSSFYIDGRMVVMSPQGAALIGEVLYEHLKDEDFNAVGGLAVGAVPLVTSLVIACRRHGKDVEGFWVREAAKAHGTQKIVEGDLRPGARVVLVDDVITSGGSLQKALDAALAKDATVVRIASLVDRESGATELFTNLGYRYDSVFTKTELLAHAKERSASLRL